MNNKFNLQIVFVLLFIANLLISKPSFISWEYSFEASKYNEKTMNTRKLLATSDGGIFAINSDSKSFMTFAKFSASGNQNWYYKRPKEFTDTTFQERLFVNNIVVSEYDNQFYLVSTSKYIGLIRDRIDNLVRMFMPKNGNAPTQITIPNDNLFLRPINLIHNDKEDDYIAITSLSSVVKNDKPLLQRVDRTGKITTEKEDTELGANMSSPMSSAMINDKLVVVNSPISSLFAAESGLEIRFYDNNFNQIINKKIDANILSNDNIFLVANNLKVNNNKIYIVGYSQTKSAIRKGYLIILNENGDLLAKKSFSEKSFATNLFIDENNVHIIGTSLSEDKKGNNLYINYNVNNGNVREYTWGENLVEDYLDDVVKLNDGSIVICGTSGSNGYLASIDKVVSDVETEKAVHDYKVNNPVFEELRISNLVGNEEITLINSLGEKVWKGKSTPIIDTKNFNSGFYLLQIERNNEISTQKIMICK